MAAWHLVHAGGSARAILLLALAAILDVLAVPVWERAVFVWLVIVFTWTSMFAMIVAAATGERGLRWDGSNTNKLVYALYVVGSIAVFPASVVLTVGLVRAL